MYDIPRLHPVTHMFGIKLEKFIVSAHVSAENQGFSILVNCMDSNVLWLFFKMKTIC